MTQRRKEVHKHTSSLSHPPSCNVAKSLGVIRSLKAALNTTLGSLRARAQLTSAAISYTQTHTITLKTLLNVDQTDADMFPTLLNLGTSSSLYLACALCLEHDSETLMAEGALSTRFRRVATSVERSNATACFCWKMSNFTSNHNHHLLLKTFIKIKHKNKKIKCR